MQRGLFFGILAAVVVIAVGAVLLFRGNDGPSVAVNASDPSQGARFELGSKDAPVTVVEFFNYLCPHCRDHSEEILPRIISEYVDTGKVRYVFRDFPFTGQDAVIRAGEAAACAYDQGQGFYKSYHDALFRSQNAWASAAGSGLDRFLGDLGGQIGLAQAQFEQCLSSGDKRAGVLADRDTALALKVSGTPSFFINGTQIENRKDWDYWKGLLDKAIAGEPVGGSESEDGSSSPGN